MSKLRRAIDGHYYVQQSLFGAGIATFQLKQQGVDFLETKGIYVDDEIPAAYMKRMRDAGFAYTGGSGLGQYNSGKFSANPDSGVERVNFVLKRSPTSWNLAIFLPELSSDLIAGIVSDGLSAKLSVKVNENTVPIVRLWPGKGGTTTDVDPSLKPYQFQLVGPWPKGNAPKFPRDIRLQTAGERFIVAGQVARRVHPASPMEPGNSYVLLTRTPLTTRSGAPEDLEDVGSDSLRKKGWFLHCFSIPDSASEDISAWCSRLGFALQQRAWKLSLLSPPPLRYSDEATAIIGSANLIFAAKRPESGTKKLDLVLQRASDPETSIQELELKLHASDITGFVSLRLPNPGTFILRGLNTWVSPLAVRFDPQSGSDSSSPQPLRVMLNDEYIEGLSQPSEALELIVDRPNCSVKVSCAVPITIECDARYREFAIASEASEFLRSIWTDLYAKRLSTICRIDAGNFGSVCFSLIPRKAKSIEPAIASLEIRRSIQRFRLRSGAQPGFCNWSLNQFPNLLVPLSAKMRVTDQQRARVMFRKLQQSQT